MKVPKIRLINDWFEHNDEIHVDFMLDIDYHDINFSKSHARYYNIPLDEIESYCMDSDLLITFTDEWDYATETVNQTYNLMSFDNWMDDYFDDEFLYTFLLDRLKEFGTPDLAIIE
tara:strand:- start:4381 stop:4728 length:348 start_codon:yes stop_codon:yes gene_type:complete